MTAIEPRASQAEQIGSGRIPPYSAGPVRDPQGLLRSGKLAFPWQRCVGNRLLPRPRNSAYDFDSEQELSARDDVETWAIW